MATDLRIVRYEERFRAEIIALWETCGLIRPWNDPGKDIDRKLTDRNGAFFVLLKSGDVVGSVMTGYDGHRGSVYYLSIHPDHQSAGLGQMLMKHCEDFLIELGCPKINLFVRRDNEAVMRFYEQLGYSEEAAVPLGKRLIPDT
ncbi:GNAT family acetyltransferase [Roseibium salinum]|uniref:GNAT family acetyltransferase n=1 Tax=Roseibium salinum TaxID=1604349 RepID=A0ABT3R0A2_9HYPH|nr:GNAT family acetyltransferase [Roseibium sp. DSM 29163]MCX2722643.1 GNAT family acetyltransferase [Roseibium sp. DSM 29163]